MIVNHTIRKKEKMIHKTTIGVRINCKRQGKKPSKISKIVESSQHLKRELTNVSHSNLACFSHQL